MTATLIMVAGTANADHLTSGSPTVVEVVVYIEGRRLPYYDHVTHGLPRKLNEKEAALLHHLLAGSFPGVDCLRLQVAACCVVRPWTPSSASIDLAVERDVPGADLVSDGPAPIDAVVYDHAGEPIGELLLWISAGYLSALEYGWFTDAPPVELPDAAHVVLDAGYRPQPH